MNKSSKKMSVLFAITCAAMVCGGTFVSCGPRESAQVVIDTSKVTLRVGQEANGFGEEWLDQTVKAYEALMKDHEFDNGKKGVQVIVEHSGYTGTAYVNKIQDSDTDVIFAEKTYYFDYVSKRALMDVSEAVTMPLTEFGESKSIVEKLQANCGTNLTDALTGFDGKYYAMPWWTGLQGVLYDVDLFNEQNLFFAKGGAPSEYQRTNANCDAALSGAFSGYLFTNLNGERSAGPDGKYGTEDDGLPATYDEFFKLCDVMAYEKTITPLLWTGRYQYGDMLIRNLYSDYEGLDNFSILYNTDGVMYDLVDAGGYELGSDGTVKYSTIKYKGDGKGYQISQTNGYEAIGSAGRLYALSFAKRLIDNPDYYSEQSFSPTFSHKDAQRYFLYSKYESSYPTIGMIIDYTCFMNEADSVFTEMEDMYEGSGRYERSLALMAPPKATNEKIGEKTTYMSRQEAYCFVNGNITDPYEKEVALSFYRFCHTDEMLKLFNKVSGGIRPFDFEYTDEEYGQIDTYAQSTYFASKYNDVLHPLVYNNLWLYNSSYFLNNSYGWTSDIPNGETSQILKAFKDNGSLTVKDYYNGILAEWNKDKWDNRMAQYYDL